MHRAICVCFNNHNFITTDHSLPTPFLPALYILTIYHYISLVTILPKNTSSSTCSNFSLFMYNLLLFTFSPSGNHNNLLYNNFQILSASHTLIFSRNNPSFQSITGQHVHTKYTYIYVCNQAHF